MNLNILKICVGAKDSIKSTLGKMSANKSSQNGLPAGIILVTDKYCKLLGIATDGDIRRALSRGMSLGEKISKIMNPNPFLLENPRNNEEILSLVVEKLKKENWHKDRLNKIIIVNEKRQVVDLLSFYDIWQKSDVRFKHIGVIGLGYVGLTLALTLADLGFKVKGFDNDSKVRISLQKGKPHFFEHGLDDLLKSHLGNNFKVVENFKGENNSEIYFIAVGTPLDKNQKPNLIFLRKAVKDLGKVLKKGDAVVLRSTVPVGTTRSFAAPILEAESGLKAGDDFMLAFAPERTVEGKALEELRHLPQVVGGINRVSVDLTANIFRFITKSIVEVDSLEEAEMVKLVNNVHRDISFAFANELSLTCNALKIDTVRVIEAANLGYDRSQISFPSPGVGGACLSKDPYIFFESAQKANYEPLLPLKAREVNKRMSKFVAGLVVDFLKKEKNKLQNSKIFILGFTFKGRPVTSDIRYSPTLDLLKHLKKHDFSICGYDPAVSKKEIEDLKVEWTTIKKGFEKADAVLVMHNNPEFEKINLKTLAKLAAKPFLLLDTFRLYPKDEAEKIENLVYKRL